MNTTQVERIVQLLGKKKKKIKKTIGKMGTFPEPNAGAPVSES